MDNLWQSLNTNYSNGPSPWAGAERRQSTDRRNYSLRSLYCCMLQPRRTRGRRLSDRRQPVLDTFNGASMTLAILLVCFSITDAVFTLTLLQHGGSELNPVMNYFLQQSVGSFMFAKLCLTALPAIVLTALGDFAIFNRFRARSILSALVGLYAGLIVYEIGLISLI